MAKIDSTDANTTFPNPGHRPSDWPVDDEGIAFKVFEETAYSLVNKPAGGEAVLYKEGGNGQDFEVVIKKWGEKKMKILKKKERGGKLRLFKEKKKGRASSSCAQQKRKNR